MKKLLIILPIVFLFGCQSPTVTSLRDEKIVSQIPINTNIVKIEDGQFVPDSIQIDAGWTVRIENNDNAIWTVISDPHPSHSQNPNLYKILHRKEFYTYEFVKPGNFGVHLEENPSISLEIMVK